MCATGEPSKPSPSSGCRKGDQVGCVETFGAGRDGADVSCACHRATNVAAGQGAGHLVTTACDIFSGAPLAGYEESVLA